MSSTYEQQFLKESKVKTADLRHRGIMNHNIAQYSKAVSSSLDQFRNLENAKRKAHLIKWRSIENLDKLLPEFEANAQKRKIKVLWANDATEALQEIARILEGIHAKTIVKSKSMVTEEIGLNEFLEKKKIHPVESDLGEFIVQLLGQKPYHIVTPAMHLQREDIATLFHERFGTPPDADAETITLKARELLRDQFMTADAAITGANYLIADTGSIALTENEGNARLSTTFPKVHIAIAGIEKIIPSLTDLDLFWPLLSSHGTGQGLTAYNSVISGPRQAGESDGPEEMYVILLDNGRTQLLASPEQRQGLYCIRCGACLNVCPVYQNIGGHSYGTTYSGPIGSLITPHTQGMKNFKHLSEASTLCGKCTEVCPVRIDISRMLLLNRRDAVRAGHMPASEKMLWKIYTTGAGKRKWMDFLGSKTKNFLLRFFFRKKWGEKRSLPQVSKQSFSQQWVSGQGHKD